MLFTETKYGNRHFCPEAGCTMVWWEDSDGTPADAQTRAMRMAAHDAFDRLWMSGQLTRKEAYRRLSESLELAPEKTHISMFNAGVCCSVVRFSEKLPLVLLKEKWC
jgi:hypothetical protein